MGEQSSAATSDFPTAVGPARTITRGRYCCCGSCLIPSLDATVVMGIGLFLDGIIRPFGNADVGKR